MSIEPAVPDLSQLREDAIAYLATQGESASAWLKVGAVAHFWRNPIEEFHHRLTDSEMARLTIDTFCRASPFIDLGEIQWDSLRGVFLDGRRLHPNGATVASMFGDDWPKVKRRVEAATRSLRRAWEMMPGGEILVEAALVDGGHIYGDCWYGSPNWPVLAAEYARLLRLDADQADCLLHRPQELDDDTWKRLNRVRYDAAMVLRDQFGGP